VNWYELGGGKWSTLVAARSRRRTGSSKKEERTTAPGGKEESSQHQGLFATQQQRFLVTSVKETVEKTTEGDAPAEPSTADWFLLSKSLTLRKRRYIKT
jgi:hypothetical protein